MGKGDEKMLERGKMDRDLVEFVVIDQLVPKEHLLRKIDTAVDFTRLYEMVEPLYCEDNGRPSIDPVVLFKMVLVPGVRDPVGGEDIFLDLFDVVPKFLRLNINGKSRAKNIFLHNSNGGCRINQLA